MNTRLLTAVLATLPLVACTAVGPDFNAPVAPAVATYNQHALKTTMAADLPLGEAQQFQLAPSVSVDWWHAFHSDQLNTLVAQALASSPSLAAAEATLRQSQQVYAAQSGATRYPLVSAKLGAQKQKSNNSGIGLAGGERIYEIYNAGVNVTYNFDLFGGNRRALEGYAAQADYQRYQWQGAQLTLAANVVTTAMSQAQYDAQIKATMAIIAAQQQQLDIAQKRYQLGAIAQGDVLSLQTLLAQTQATLPALQNRLAQTRTLLATLIDKTPAEVTLPQFTLSDFQLPTALPLVVPSELVRQRPDIQASESLFHVASAQYGVAVASAYPQINLSANLGSQALAASSLFGAGSIVWGLASQLVQPLFNGGLQAGIKGAEASFDAAAANYRVTVLQAFRNVADVLQVLESDAQILQAQAQAYQSAQAALNLVQQQYKIGSATYLQLLTAQQQAQQTQIALVAAQTQRLTDTVAFYQAMGGGMNTPSTTIAAQQSGVEK
jgi:NodT family efflux transporter outer membrane factor (OMF) lipoprotein